MFRTAMGHFLVHFLGYSLGFIEIYLTKQHKFLCFQEYFERLNGGCKLQPPLWFWGQIAFRRVFPIVSAALCFMPDVE